MFLMCEILLFFVILFIYSNDFIFYKIGWLGSMVKFDKCLYFLRYMLENCEI